MHVYENKKGHVNYEESNEWQTPKTLCIILLCNTATNNNLHGNEPYHLTLIFLYFRQG